MEKGNEKSAGGSSRGLCCQLDTAQMERREEVNERRLKKNDRGNIT